MIIPRPLTVLAAGLLAVGCGESTGLDSESLAGTWVATSAVLTNPANTSQTVDLVSEGFRITFVIESDGSVEGIFEFEGTVDQDSGTLTVVGNEVTLVLDGDPSTGTISRSGDTLILNLITGIEWDFDGDNLDEPATLLIVLEKSS